MKKIFAMIILLASLISLTSCGSKYPAQKSTDEESAIVMTVSFEGKKYEVKYELYRALFLNLRESVDGGDSSVWSGADKDTYVNKIDALIKERAAEIYAIFHVADKIGINVYSEEYDELVEDYITVSVDGGYFANTEITGFDGDYDKYLEHLTQINLNYSVQDLLIRYTLATEDIYEYYAGTINSEEFVENAGIGKLEYTKEDVKAFYDSDECVRVLRAFLPEKYFTEKRAEEIRQKILDAAKTGESAVAGTIISYTTTGATDIKNGDVIAKYNLDGQFYGELVSAAFETEMFCVSDVIKITTGIENGYMVIYRAPKNSLHFDECYDDIAEVYVQNEIGKIIDTDAAKIAEALTATKLLDSIDRANVSMQ